MVHQVVLSFINKCAHYPSWLCAMYTTIMLDKYSVLNAAYNYQVCTVIGTLLQDEVSTAEMSQLNFIKRRCCILNGEDGRYRN